MDIKTIKAELDKLKQKKADVKLVIKGFDLEGADADKLDELKSDLDARKAEDADLDAQISDLEKELADAEAEQDELAEAVEKKNAHDIKTKGFKKMEDYKKYMSVDGDGMKDFADALVKNAGKSFEDVQKSFKEAMEAKGFTNPDILVPEPVANAITDEFEKSVIWSSLKHTGLSSKKIAQNINTSDTSRARGHKKGNDKNEQVITVAIKKIVRGMVYKYITIDREDILENTAVDIVAYVLNEMPVQIVNELERAVVVGDGREVTDAEHITSFEAIINGATADATPTTQNPNGAIQVLTIVEQTGDAYDALIDADAEIKTEGEKLMIASTAFIKEIRKQRDTNGALLVPFGADLASALGVSRIVTKQFMDGAKLGEDDLKAVIFTPQSYLTVGKNSIDSFRDFTLKQNKEEFLSEIYMGGALAEWKSAVAITKPAGSTGGATE